MYNVQQISYMGTYSIPEVCQMINRSERTVRQMIANGLTTIDDKRPTLIRGTNLIGLEKFRQILRLFVLILINI